MSLRPTTGVDLEVLIRRPRSEPIGCDISDYSDEWTQGFLAGQQNALQVLWRRLECSCVHGMPGLLFVRPKCASASLADSGSGGG